MKSHDVWQVAVARQAWNDFTEILAWTAEEFGSRQSLTYERTITEAVEALHSGPDVAGARRRDEISPGLRSLHVARHRRRGRHFIFFVVDSEERRLIRLLRILHDSMDFARHLGTRDE